MASLKEIDRFFLSLESKDNNTRYEAFKALLLLTEKKVDWIYDKWHLLADKLSSDNSFQRSIGFMLIANLSLSDDENRLSGVINNLLNCMNDEKFITSRQCIQCVWEIAVNKKALETIIVESLKNMFYNNVHLKTHGNLIKQDVISSLLRISEQNNEVTGLISNLIEEENEDKLKKVFMKIISAAN